MAKVFIPALAGKTANLPHTEQGLRPISFRPETGEAFVKDVKRVNGVDVRENEEFVPVLDEEGEPVLDENDQPVTELVPGSGNTVLVERSLTKDEVEAVQTHLHLFGVVVT